MESQYQNVWARFGFSDNPFDTKALSKSGNLPIEQAYIKRADYNEIGGILDSFLFNPGGGNIIIEGDSGVGKTTFINYHKLIWKSKSKDIRLFSSDTEISVQSYWRIENFIYNALGVLLSQIRLDIGERKFNKSRLLKELLSQTGVLFQTNPGISANIGLPTLFSVGGAVSKDTSITTGKNIESQLKDYFSKVVGYIKKMDYHGIILHFNNLELLQNGNEQELITLFNDIRDILQTRDIYFVFVGGKSLYQKIVFPISRVRSIFHDEPIIIPPLPPQEVIEIINTRYKIFGKGANYTKPVNDEVIQFLSESFNGRVRDIMNTITNLIFRIPEGMVNTLDLKDVKVKLLSIEENKLLKYGLSGNHVVVLKIMLELEVFNNAELVDKTSKTKQHINKFIKKFLDLQLIEHYEKVGRISKYRIHPRMNLLLRLLRESA